MKKSFLLFLLLLIIKVSYSFGCSCQGPNYFCNAMNSSYFSTKTGVIVKAVKIDQDTIKNSRLHLPFMRVKVLDILKGQTTSDTIVVLGQDGLNCYESLRYFEDNDTLILGFNVVKDTTNLFFCARLFLHVKNGMVTGNILNDFKNSMPYDSFLTFLKSTPCQTATTINDAVQINNSINIFPNPSADGIFNLQFNLPLSNLKLSVYNSCGQLVKQEILKARENIPVSLDLSAQPKGIYFIKAEERNNSLTAKVLKE